MFLLFLSAHRRDLTLSSLLELFLRVLDDPRFARCAKQNDGHQSSQVHPIPVSGHDGGYHQDCIPGSFFVDQILEVFCSRFASKCLCHDILTETEGYEALLEIMFDHLFTGRIFRQGFLVNIGNRPFIYEHRNHSPTKWTIRKRCLHCFATKRAKHFRNSNVNR